MSSDTRSQSPSRRYTTGEVLQMLTRLRGDRSLRRMAKDMGLSVAYLSDVMRENRAPSKRILKPLGLRRVVEFRVYYVADAKSNLQDFKSKVEEK